MVKIRAKSGLLNLGRGESGRSWGKWTVQSPKSGRSWVKVDGPKRHKVDGLRKWTGRKTKGARPQKMKMNELLKIILLTPKNVPKATNQPKLGCKPSQAKKNGIHLKI